MCARVLELGSGTGWLGLNLATRLQLSITLTPVPRARADSASSPTSSPTGPLDGLDAQQRRVHTVGRELDRRCPNKFKLVALACYP